MELLYLPVRGRGEALHMIAAYGRVPLKKVDIPLAKWPDLKSTIPTNKAGKQQVRGDSLLWGVHGAGTGST